MKIREYNSLDQIFGGWTDNGGNVIADECCPDINGKGYVDVYELLEVIDQWGTCSGCSADFDEDGLVNVVDLLTIIGNWGPCE